MYNAMLGWAFSIIEWKCSRLRVYIAPYCLRKSCDLCCNAWPLLFVFYKAFVLDIVSNTSVFPRNIYHHWTIWCKIHQNFKILFMNMIHVHRHYRANLSAVARATTLESTLATLNLNSETSKIAISKYYTESNNLP